MKNWLNNIFSGHKKPDFEQPRVFSSSSFRELLDSISPEAKVLFESDQKSAIAWYQTVSHPDVKPDGKFGVDWFLGMAQTASTQAIWTESWALAHHGLFGALKCNLGASAPKACWLLGESQAGKEAYSMAAMYLDAAVSLADTFVDDDMLHRAMYDRTVVSVLADPTNSPDRACETLITFLKGRRKTNPNTLTEANAALWLYKRADQLALWWRDGKPRRDCCVYAAGYYAASIHINRILDTKRALGIILGNLGLMWRQLGEGEKAMTCWSEALTFTEASGDAETKSLIRKRIQDFSSSTESKHFTTKTSATQKDLPPVGLITDPPTQRSTSSRAQREDQKQATHEPRLDLTPQETLLLRQGQFIIKGMSIADVNRLLGPCQNITTMADVVGAAGTAAVLGSRNSPLWRTQLWKYMFHFGTLYIDVLDEIVTKVEFKP